MRSPRERSEPAQPSLNWHSQFLSVHLSAACHHPSSQFQKGNRMTFVNKFSCLRSLKKEHPDLAKSIYRLLLAPLAYRDSSSLDDAVNFSLHHLHQHLNGCSLHTANPLHPSYRNQQVWVSRKLFPSPQHWSSTRLCLLPISFLLACYWLHISPSWADWGWSWASSRIN